jgi:hypothetical protein
MNQELIDMARGAGVRDDEHRFEFSEYKYLEAFAELVKKHTLMNIDPKSWMSWQEGYEAGRLAEREACAKLCDYVYDNIVTDEHIKDMAFKIRARGETK